MRILIEEPDIVTNQIDHFPNLLKHFNNQRLMETTRDYIRRARDGVKTKWDDCEERAAMCQAECERRNLPGFRGQLRRRAS